MPNPDAWELTRIRTLVQEKFRKRACWFQVTIAKALYEGKDVVGVAPTGSGKTLSFWIPLLMAFEEGHRDKMTFVVTPLNLLGKQNERELREAGFNAIAVSRENANENTFKDIEAGKYAVIILNPELLMGNYHIEQWWKKPKFTKRILNFIFDEGHCIKQWGSFRKEYLHVGELRYLIPDIIPFYVASATLPPAILHDVIETLRLRPDMTEKLIQSNERPDLRLMVRPLVYPAKSFKDLEFLIPDNFREGDPPPSKFLVFFDNTKEAEAACKRLRNRLPSNLRKKLVYFHSTMTQEYREAKVDDLRESEVWGKFTTDSFGMGLDVPDIKIVVQYKATCDMCTLWQRFGRAARSAEHVATVILLAEKKDLKDEREQAHARKERKNGDGKASKRKADGQLTFGAPPSKRARLETVHALEAIENLEPADKGKAVICDNGLEKDELPTVEEKKLRYMRDDRGENRSSRNSRWKGRELLEGSALFDLINPSPTFECRRAVITVYFGNDKIVLNDHLICDPSQPTGCARCAPKKLDICCDLCQPNFFDQYWMYPDQQSRGTGKSRLKPFEPAESDLRLMDELFKWRKEKALVKFGRSFFETLGANLLMSDEVIERIVACVHSRKIKSLEDVTKETGWTSEASWVAEFGGSLMEVIQTYSPPAPPLGPCEKQKRGPSTCTACGQSGHRSKSFSFKA
ncbi:P-loop containing nucleoside triphosphate hydrolase protein [Amanita muscaria]